MICEACKEEIKEGDKYYIVINEAPERPIVYCESCGVE